MNGCGVRESVGPPVSPPGPLCVPERGSIATTPGGPVRGIEEPLSFPLACSARKVPQELQRAPRRGGGASGGGGGGEVAHGRGRLAFQASIALALLLLAAACAHAVDPGAPTHVLVVDDPEDDRGNVLLVSWIPPREIVQIPGMRPVGYQVISQQEGMEPQLGPVVPLEATEAALDELKPWPWPAYEITVAMRYEPPAAPAAALPGVEPPFVLLKSDPVGPVRPEGRWYFTERTNILVLAVIICVIVLGTLYAVRRSAESVYIRPIAGLEAVDDAIGRATEMGKPIVYVSGLSGIGDIATIAAMLILGHLSRRAAAYEVDVIVPCMDPMVMAAEREIVRQAYTEAGKPDAYKPENIFYLTDSQFGYVAAVDGIMVREQPAACFYMGYFFAEALILAETGNQTGAIQIAGTDADTQLPFFITACDYTLMGEELYAASAYLSRQPLLVAQLCGQDIAKTIIAAILILGVGAATAAALTGGRIAELLERFIAWFAS